jgi:alpha-amylase
MGFDAIWISPIIKQTSGGYHGYWAQNFYEINPHFGSEKDLVDLIEECHKKNIWVNVNFEI